MKRLYLAISLIGVNSICSQIILIRELIAVFSGNELTMGFVLASWFFWVAIGSTIGGRWKAKNETSIRNRFTILLISIPFLLILQIILIRWSRILLGLPQMAIVGMGPIFWVSFLFISPLCLILGMMFSLGYQWIVRPQLSPARRVGWAYVLEAVGSGIGGCLFSFLLIRIMSHFQISLLLGIVNLLSSVLNFSQKPERNRPGIWISGCLSILFLSLFFSSPFFPMDFLIYTLQWKDFKLLACEDSIFGRIVLSKFNEEYIFYEHGILTSTIPDPWTEEWTVHLPFVQHPEPENVLLIGTGIGSLKEAIKYSSLKRIDYLELDPLALTLAEQYCPKNYIELLNHPKVLPIHKDARLYTKETDLIYDLVIIGLPDPKTAQLNRMYTVEFYNIISNKLSKDGVMAFSVTSSENYIGPHLGDFLRCIYKTVSQVFPETLVTPGDTAYFLAGKNKDFLTLDPNRIVQRLSGRRVKTHFFSEWYLPSHLSEERINGLKLILKDTEGVWINKDLRPICYFYDLILWGRYFSPTTGKILEKVKDISGRGLLLFFTILTIVFAICTKILGREKGQRLTVGTVVMLGGFIEIVLEFLLILGFQVFYGYAYLQLGILITAFMVGLTIGSALMTHILDSLKKLYIWYCGIQISYLIYPLFIIFLFTRINVSFWPAKAVESIFILLTLIAGFMGGFQFPIATDLFLSANQKWKGQAGLLYGLDLIGAAFGAILASSYLVPIFGILATLGVLSLMGGIGLTLLLVNI
jgi:spermidine synthase